VTPGRGLKKQGLLLRRLDLCQHFFGVAVGLHVLEDVGDFAVRADEECSSSNPHHLFAIHVLFLDHIKLFGNCFILIGKERVGQLVLLFELLLGRRGIGGNAEYGYAGPGEFGVCVAEPARFYRSTGCVGLGVEEQDHGFAAKLLQFHRVPILIR
jgi:hypothetical protein